MDTGIGVKEVVRLICIQLLLVTWSVCDVYEERHLYRTDENIEFWTSAEDPEISSWTDNSWTTKIRRVQPVLEEPGNDGPGNVNPGTDGQGRVGHRTRFGNWGNVIRHWECRVNDAKIAYWGSWCDDDIRWHVETGVGDYGDFERENLWKETQFWSDFKWRRLEDIHWETRLIVACRCKMLEVNSEATKEMKSLLIVISNYIMTAPLWWWVRLLDDNTANETTMSTFQECEMKKHTFLLLMFLLSIIR